MLFYTESDAFFEFSLKHSYTHVQSCRALH